MKNSDTIKKIQTWLDGSRDYNEGRELLKTVPGGVSTNMQLTLMETHESKVRLVHWLKKGIEILKDERD